MAELALSSKGGAIKEEGITSNEVLVKENSLWAQQLS